MAGGVQYHEGDVAEFEFFTVGGFVFFKLRLGVGTVDDGGAGLPGQVEVS